MPSWNKHLPWTLMPSWNNRPVRQTHAAMEQTSVLRSHVVIEQTSVMEQARRRGTIVLSRTKHAPAIFPCRRSCIPGNSRESSGAFRVLCSPRRSLPDARNRPGLTERPPQKIAKVQWGPRMATEPQETPQDSAIILATASF